MVENYLRNDICLLGGFLGAAVLAVAYVIIQAAECGEGVQLILAAAFCCLVSLGFSFLCIGGHLKTNAKKLYGEELLSRQEEKAGIKGGADHGEEN